VLLLLRPPPLLHPPPRRHHAYHSTATPRPSNSPTTPRLSLPLRYYPLFGLGANVALIFSGQYVKWVSTLRSNLPAGVDPWGFSLRYLMGAVVASGGVIALLYKHIAENCISAAAKKKAKVKTKLTLGESAAYLGKSTYIRDMAMLVIGYGMSINLVEVTWKARLKQQFTDPNAYVTTLLLLLLLPNSLSHPLASQVLGVYGKLLERHRGCDLYDDDPRPLHLQAVRVGRGRGHHPAHAPLHGGGVLLAGLCVFISRSLCVCPLAPLTSSSRRSSSRERGPLWP